MMGKSEYNKKYYQDNLEREKERRRNWYHENKDKFDKEKLSEYHKEYYQNNKHKWRMRTPEKQAEYNANRRDKYANDSEYRERIKNKVKEYHDNNPKQRKRQRLKKYDMTLDEYHELLDSQNHKCAICGYSDKSDKNFFPLVDHDHNTGKVRGLLCANCNHALGKFKDDIGILKSAINYLEVNDNG